MLLHAQNLEPSMANHILGTPVKLGRHTLNNRIVLPPLTRQRSAQPGDNAPELPETFRRAVRAAFSGRLIYAGRYTAERGATLLEAGLADLIGFG